MIFPLLASIEKRESSIYSNVVAYGINRTCERARIGLRVLFLLCHPYRKRQVLMEPYIMISIAAGVLAMLGYGISDFFGSIVSKREDPIGVNIWYFAVSAALLAIVVVALYRPLVINIYGIALMAVTSVFSVLGLVFFVKGLKVGKLSVVAPISGAFSIIPIIAGVMFLSEVPTLVQYAGIALAISGTVLASIGPGSIMGARRRALLPGVKYGLLTMLSWGIFYTGMGVLSRSLGWAYPALISAAASAAMLALFSMARHRSLKLPRLNFPIATLWAVIGTVALVSYDFGAEYGSISLVSPITASAVLITVMLGFIVLKERLSRNQLAGICAIIAGIILIAL